VPLFFARDREAAVDYSGESSRTTHGAPTTVDACRYLGGLIVDALGGTSKDELLAARSAGTPEIDAIARGSFLDKEPPEIRGGGYVVHSLEAALWAFARTETFRDGALAAVNLGDDADTTGAVYGQLAGAFYGDEAIPAEWRAKLALRDTIASLADRLHEAAA
jgi:ADP-ribosyl-[dinitrogen reductase] hydrolase